MHTASPPRPLHTAALAVRVGVVVVAAIAAAVAAPTAVRAPLALLAGVVVIESVASRWGAGPVDGVAIGVGLLLAGLVLAGVALDVAPGGIDRLGWAVAAGLGGSTVVIGARPGRPSWATRRLFRLSPRAGWYLAGVALVAAGIVASVAAEHHADVAPVALAVRSTAPGAGGITTIEISSGASGGPYSLVEGTGPASLVLATGIEVTSAQPATLRVATVPGERITVRLVQGAPSTGRELRRLVLQAP